MQTTGMLWDRLNKMLAWANQESLHDIIGFYALRKRMFDHSYHKICTLLSGSGNALGNGIR